MLLDTNVVIYSCQADGGWLAQWTGTRMPPLRASREVEALGFVEIAPAEESRFANNWAGARRIRWMRG